jgi:hypothetical protein
MPTAAGPGTNEYRCASCGRFFNSEDEFTEHRKECEAREQRPREGGREHEKDREWISRP